MSTDPNLDELFENLRRAGWQLDEKETIGRWNVSLTCGSATLQAEGLTREEALRRAWEQVQAAAAGKAKRQPWWQRVNWIFIIGIILILLALLVNLGVHWWDAREVERIPGLPEHEDEPAPPPGRW